MLPRERVISVIEGKSPDRIPLYAWLRANLDEKISKKYGSVDAFEDKYEFDYAHIFGGPLPYDMDIINSLKKKNGEITPNELLSIPLNDVDDMSKYKSVVDGISHYKEKRGRFVYVQSNGIFECLNDPFGIENHLAYLIMYKEKLHEVYKRQAEWNKKFASNMIDLGVDMVHVSDDWGSQNSLMFSPKIWWDMIYPYHKMTADLVKDRDTYLSLHSDGNITQVLDGIVKLGFDVVHPYQESANMSYSTYTEKYKDKFTIMGGLDVQTTIGFNKYDYIESELKRILSIFKNKKIMLCTSHFIQDHCSIEELEYTFDLIYDLLRKTE